MYMVTTYTLHTHTHHTHITVPSAPALTLLSAISSTTLLVAWIEPTITNGNIEGYLVSYSTGTEQPSIETVIGNVLTTNLTGLTPDTTYDVFVRAMTTFIGPPSQTISNRTLEDGTSDVVCMYVQYS